MQHLRRRAARGLAVAQDNGVPPLPRRAPGAERRPGSGPLARPVLSLSDLDRVRAALDMAGNREPAEADADVLPAPPASGPGGVTPSHRVNGWVIPDQVPAGRGNGQASPGQVAPGNGQPSS